MMTRRGLLAASLGLAGGALGLAGCGLLRKGEEVPDITISDGEDALAYALSALEERYGEGFSQAEGTEITSYMPDDTDLTYELCACPASDPSKVFGCDISTDRETGRLLDVLEDDYTQYRFKGQVEGPFLEVVRGLAGVAGYSVQLSQPYVGDRDWRPDELEAYLANGFTQPEAMVTLMLPIGATREGWAHTVHELLAGVWGLGRRMDVQAEPEGYDPYSGMPLYVMETSQCDPARRDSEPPTEEHVLGVMGSFTTEGVDHWDGTGDAGDPGYVKHPQITWYDGHPVMPR
ncbi:hypothetical protein [Olsenella uli]|uniref:hypothetical protein n=1 Tax=Olsenella uli TaxID=133926 RepID=UPI00242A73E4|nr:hypothetical protein [Olsenella uli]